MKWLQRQSTETVAPALTVESVHEDHGDFVWASLQRMGIREADLEDVFQEVFLVVHQRLHTFEGRSKLTTWLFGICLHVANAHRRRAYVRREEPSEYSHEIEDAGHLDPETSHAQTQARATLAALLEELDAEKRAVFVMTEVEELPAQRIAELMGVPIGTVYSRLHAARKQFEQAVARQQLRTRSGGVR